MRSELTVVKQINTKLSSEVHQNWLKTENGKQCSCRSCLIIKGCKAPGSQTTNKGDNKNVIAQIMEEVEMDKDDIKKKKQW